MSEPITWITKNGKHIPIYADQPTADEKKKNREIKQNEEESEKKNSAFTPSEKQLELEEKIRNRENGKEYSAFLDKDGNILFDMEGSEEEVTLVMDEEHWDDVIKFNRNVEQRVWANEEVNHTHNHTLNTIFSPEDVFALEDLEHHSESAVLPNGVTYRLIRNQPREKSSDNPWIVDMKTGTSKREFEAKKIYEPYNEAYSAIYLPKYEEIKKNTSWLSKERRQAIEKLDQEVTQKMEKWLTKNAEKYGYIFIKETH